MSIEYTLDIQLTELGFPDIVEPSEAPDAEAGGQSTSISSTNKQRRQLSKSTAKTGTSRHTRTASDKPAPLPQPEPGPCHQSDPVQSQQDGPGIELCAAEPTCGRTSPQSPELITQQGPDEPSVSTDLSSGQPEEDEEDDSDDSEVSEGFEEEELDEDDCTEDEEGTSNELTQPGDFRCSVCNLQVTSEFKLQDHMNLHTGVRPYCCAECGKRFCQIYNYRVHLRTHALTHQAKMNRLQCRICLLCFDSEKELKNHLSVTHFEKEFYECDLCKRVFTSLKDCEHHVQLHSCMLTFVCDICGRNFSSQKSLVRHQKKRCRRHFKCTDCSASFPKKNALLKHSFSHLGLLPYTCIRCHCHFRLARLYRRHKCEPQRIHCIACLREFVNEEEFQRHKKDTGCWGNREQNVIKDEVRCLECGQKFDTSEELKKHAGAHQRVLKCAECGKGFRSALLLMSHMGGHAGKSPCLCQSCGLGFPHQQNYDSHLKTCGQTSSPLVTSKKQPKLKRSSSKTEDVGVILEPSKPVRSASTLPAVRDQPLPTTSTPVGVSQEPSTALKQPTAPVSAPSLTKQVKEPAMELKMSPAPQSASTSPALVTNGVYPGSGQSDGLWKLTLNEQPPPGVKLVVFLPVCSTQVGDASLQSGVPPTLTLPALSPAALFPVPTNGLARENAAFTRLLNVDQELSTGIKNESDKPLDLSRKHPASLTTLKSEPEVFEISDSMEKEEDLSNHAEAKGGDTKAIKTERKYVKVELTDILPVVNNKRPLPSDLPHIKKEPLSPKVVCPSGPSTLTETRPEKKIKMEDKL